MFKKLLTLTAIFEGSTGLIILIAPASVVSLLLGASIHEPSGIFICRLAGVTLATISIICWSSRTSQNEATGIIPALLFYNTAAAVLLIGAWMNGFSGLGIWPASLLHAAMAVWCLKLLMK